jgi:hypothetical protein
VINEGMTVELTLDLFSGDEQIIATNGELVASAFRYRSGVAALRIRNSLGEIVVLPFQGQQIWDASFRGRRLTMGSMFDEPVATSDYLSNYGAFLIHCGMTAMGNPGPRDRHPLHGELPNAVYESAALEIGEDADGLFMAVSGVYRHRVAFTAGYVATPRLRLNAGSSLVHSQMTVRNTRQSALEAVYLAHVNFRPIDGARLVDSVPDDADHIRVRTDVPPLESLTPEHRAFIEAAAASPKVHRDIVKGRPVDPEIVLVLKARGGADGLQRALQVHPDGSGDIIIYRPDQLPVAVRWMTRTGDEDAIGIVLPATAEPNGLEAARAAGQMMLIPPGGEFYCEYSFGALDAAGVQEALREIAGG